MVAGASTIDVAGRPSVGILVERPLLGDALAVLLSGRGYRATVIAAPTAHAPIEPPSMVMSDVLVVDDGGYAHLAGGGGIGTEWLARLVVLSANRADGHSDAPIHGRISVSIDNSAEDLYAAIEAALSESHVPPPRSSPWAAQPAGGSEQRQAKRLTSRQTDILQRVASGQPTSTIAAELNLSVRTVRTHIHNIFVQLGVHSRLQAAAYAARLDLV